MSRWMRLLIVLVLGMTLWPSLPAVGQALIPPSNGYDCPSEVQSPPDGASTSGQVRGVEAVAQGEPFTADEGGPAERTYTVISTGYTPGFDLNTHRRLTENNMVIVCLEVAYAESATALVLETGYFRLGTRDDEVPGFTDYTATARFNGASDSDTRDIGNAQTAWTINFENDSDQIIPLAFKVYPNQPTEMFLTEGDPIAISRDGTLEWAMLVNLPDPSGADLVPSASGPPGPAPSVNGGSGRGTEPTQAAGNQSGSTVTAFNEPTVITLGLDKWRLTFDPAVEVRTFIGDYSIVPTRGQFLVIWFNQLSLSAEPLPLGSFALQTSTGAGEPFAVRPLAREGTAALIVTEYTWNPDLMSADTEYRTGIVFDIAPEDTHFVLQYQGPAQTLGNPYVVDLEFDA